MESNLKKLLPAVGAMCLSFASLSAASTAVGDNNPPAVDSLTTHINASAGTRPADDMGGFVSLDYLLWQPNQSGMAIAEDGVPATATTAYPTGVGSVFAKPHLLSGFKVAAGANLDHDAWDIVAEYTWLNQGSRAMKATNPTAVGGSNLIPTFAVDYLNNRAQISQALSNWRFQFNNIDLDLGRSYFYGHYATLRPFLGLKGSWQTQNLAIQYINNNATGHNDFLTQNQNFWGVGAHTGVGSEFLFNSEWGIFCNFALSALYSQFTMTTQNARQLVTGAAKLQTANIKSSDYGVSPVLEMAIGLRWDTNWSDSWAFRLQAGWEQQVWWGQNHFNGVGSKFNSVGDLSFQGLTIKARLDF